VERTPNEFWRGRREDWAARSRGVQQCPVRKDISLFFFLLADEFFCLLLFSSQLHVRRLQPREQDVDQQVVHEPNGEAKCQLKNQKENPNQRKTNKQTNQCKTRKYPKKVNKTKQQKKRKRNPRMNERIEKKKNTQPFEEESIVFYFFYFS
jgi:hypothetical protein